MNYTAELESYLLHHLSHVKLPWLLFGGYVIFAALFGFFAMGVDNTRAGHLLVQGESQIAYVSQATN